MATQSVPVLEKEQKGDVIDHVVSRFLIWDLCHTDSKETVQDEDHEKVDYEKGSYADNLLANGHVQVTAELLHTLEAKLPEMPVEEAKRVGY